MFQLHETPLPQEGAAGVGVMSPGLYPTPPSALQTKWLLTRASQCPQTLFQLFLILKHSIIISKKHRAAGQTYEEDTKCMGS